MTTTFRGCLTRPGSGGDGRSGTHCCAGEQAEQTDVTQGPLMPLTAAADQKICGAATSEGRSNMTYLFSAGRVWGVRLILRNAREAWVRLLMRLATE